jgi:hypothetical protein
MTAKRAPREGTASPLSASRLRGLKAPLDQLYDTFNHAESAVDPVHVVRRYAAPEDQEVVAFCSSCWVRTPPHSSATLTLFETAHRCARSSTAGSVEST